jgi:fatty-acyl-CoA synthase
MAISGPTVFRGYVENVHNQDIWLEKDWFNTGDLGRQDADGYFWFTGRKKELIIRGGHNIDPKTIEDAFYKLPEVQVAAAVGRPDAHAGEVPVVYLQLTEGSTADAEELLIRASEHMGERAAIPKAVHILDEVPLTPVGKIFKPALRWDLIAHTYREAIGDAGAVVEVIAKEDKLHGTRVDIRVTDTGGQEPDRIEKTIRRKLALYTIPFTIQCVQ